MAQQQPACEKYTIVPQREAHDVDNLWIDGPVDKAEFHKFERWDKSPSLTRDSYQPEQDGTDKVLMDFAYVFFFGTFNQ